MLHAWAKLAELSLSCLESNFLGVKSADKQEMSAQRVREMTIQWQLNFQVSAVSTVMCLVPAPCDRVFLDAGWLNCSDFCSETEVQLLKQKWPHLMDTLTSKGSILLDFLHLGPLAHSLSLLNRRISGLWLCKPGCFFWSFAGLWIFSLP